MPEDITQWREDMNVMSEWQEQDLTSERSEILFLPREHKIHIFKLTCNVLFCYNYKHTNLMMAFLMIF